MGWKLRKDKLRAETNDDAMPPADPNAEAELAASAPAEATAPEADVLHSEAQAAGDVPAFNTASDLDAQPLSSEAEALPLDKPEPSVFAMGADPVFGDSPALDPLSFAPASDLDSGGTFAEDDTNTAPVFAIDNLDPAAEGADSGAEEAPVFGLDSVFTPEEGDETPLFAPLSSAFDPLPDDAADTFAMPMPGPEPLALGGDTDTEPIVLGGGMDTEPIVLGGGMDTEPIVLGGEASGTFGAFAPYQPPNDEPESSVLAMGTADDDAYSDPDLEIGAMAFNPQSPSVGTFALDAPTAGEEIAQETTAPAFADPRDTSPLAFEPAFEAPDALAGESLPNMPDDGDEPFMDRDSLAAGLVTMEASTGLPRVAPFVLPGEDKPAFGDSEDGPHSLTLRLGSLSATYPLTKPVTTIGRPDRDTATYPDIEVELDDGVSRRHAEVRQEDGLAYLVDMGSTNGTILNGEMLTANQPARLMHGDRIRIGERVEIVFE